MEWATAATITAVSAGLIAGMVKIFATPAHKPCENIRELELKVKEAERKIESSNVEIKVLRSEDQHIRESIKRLESNTEKILNVLINKN